MRHPLPAKEIPSPLPDQIHNQVVRVRHPGYDDAGNTLLSFPAVDDHGEGQQQELGGVHAQLVYTACTIVSGNKHGFLSRDKSGTDIAWKPQSSAATECDQVLRAGDYYFHVSSPPPTAAAGPSTTPLAAVPDLRNPYAVCPTFREWQPPAHIPESFHASVTDNRQPPPPGARTIDSRCYVTAETDAIECAHMVPLGEVDWFGANAMWNHHPPTLRVGKEAINKHGNLILLRRDIHYLFDSSHFTIFPRRDENDAYQPTVHVLTTEAPSLYKEYHGRCLRPLRGISAHFLFARFAWSIFPLVRGFFQAGVTRSVLLAGGIEQRKAGSVCEELVRGQGAGRSGLSPKRKSASRTKSTSPEKRICTGYVQDSPDSAVAGLEQAKETRKRRRSSSSADTRPDDCINDTEEEDDTYTSSEEITDPDELRFYAAQGMRAPKRSRTLRERDDVWFSAAQGRGHGFVESEWEDDDGWEEEFRGRTRYRSGQYA